MDRKISYTYKSSPITCRIHIFFNQNLNRTVIELNKMLINFIQKNIKPREVWTLLRKKNREWELAISECLITKLFNNLYSIILAHRETNELTEKERKPGA